MKKKLPKEERIIIEAKLAGSKKCIKFDNNFYFSPSMYHLYELESGKDLDKFMKSLKCIIVEDLEDLDKAIKDLTPAN